MSDTIDHEFVRYRDTFKSNKRIINIKVLVNIVLFCAGILFYHSSSFAQKTTSIDSSVESKGEVQLHFFWSKKCPHCLQARPFVLSLAEKNAWILLHDLELTAFPENITLYQQMASELGEEARSVPAFFWCGKMLVGYDDEKHMGKYLYDQLHLCREQNQNGAANQVLKETSPFINLPILGQVDPSEYSLPMFTLLIASLDAFNPCAFFVLLFLLSMLVHARSRKRMLFIGGVFVLISGVLYFLFMAAWLNVFLLIGQVNTITLVAGILAILFSIINIKDFFWFKQGVSLSIPDSAKPKLFQRVRLLVNANNIKTMLLATIALALFANTYELLCTAGFPMVYTRMLTLSELSDASYYRYLLFYNIVYVIPLAFIVLVFVATLGGHKLQEKHGRLLKLISGNMMLLLGLVLVFVPNWLNNFSVALSIFSLSLLISGIIYRFSPVSKQEN